MTAKHDYVEIVDCFSLVAHKYCTVVDSASSLDRADLLLQIYKILPELIGEAIRLPTTELNNDDETEETSRPTLPAGTRMNEKERLRLYNLLKEKLGDWDLYWQVFDPTKDTEAIYGTLADDMADIYRDLQEGLVLAATEQAQPADIIWEWRVGFYSHWGKHAMDALRTIHFRLEDTLC